MIHSISLAGKYIAVYGVCLVLCWYGLFKFTPTEAEGIKELVRNSPLMSWMYHIGSLQQVSNFIGIIELATALALALFPFFPRVAFYGGIASGIIFTTTLSFLLTTPGLFARVDGFWLPAGDGGFIIKDVVLLGVSLWIAGMLKETRPSHS